MYLVGLTLLLLKCPQWHGRYSGTNPSRRGPHRALYLVRGRFGFVSFDQSEGLQMMNQLLPKLPLVCTVEKGADNAMGAP